MQYMDVKAAAEEIVKYGKQLYDRFVFSGTDGNISIRVGEDEILTTPTGVPKNALTDNILVLTDMNGNNISEGKASSELKMHLEIYKKRADIHAVIHAHGAASTAFALTGEALGGKLTEAMVMFPNGIPLSPYYEAGSEKLAISAASTLGDAYAILLQRHGTVTVGATIAQAAARMDALENIAKTELFARLLSFHLKF